MDIEKFKASLRRLLKKGKNSEISIEEIKKIFEGEIANMDRQMKPKKTRKKKICRPVMMISDSSCDEIDQIDYQSNLSSLSSSFRLPTSSLVCRQ